MNPGHTDWTEIWETLVSPERADPAIIRHLGDCARCRRRVTEAKRLLELLAASRLPSPSQDLVLRTQARVHQALAEAAAHAREPRSDDAHPADWREWLARAADCWAELVADSWRPAAHLRGAAQTSPRMLRYETETHSVVLSLAASGDRIDVDGQVSPRRDPSLPAGGRALAEVAGRLLDAEVSALGEFRLRGVKGELGEVSVLLGADRIRLRVPPQRA